MLFTEVSGCRMARAVVSASVPMARLTRRWKSMAAWSSGRQVSSMRAANQVAKDSLSQASSHHGMVTKLPNHWCACSWAMTSTISLRLSSGVLPSTNSSRSSR